MLHHRPLKPKKRLRALARVLAALATMLCLALSGCHLDTGFEDPPELEVAEAGAAAVGVWVAFGTIATVTLPAWVVPAIIATAIVGAVAVLAISYQRNAPATHTVTSESGSQIATTCPQDVYDGLVQLKNAACQRYNSTLDGSCTPGMSCAEILAKQAANIACAKARGRMMARCFGNGLADDGHGQALHQRSAVAAKCARIACMQGCLDCGYGYFATADPNDFDQDTGAVVVLDEQYLSSEWGQSLATSYSCSEGYARSSPRWASPFVPQVEPELACTPTCRTKVSQLYGADWTAECHHRPLLPQGSDYISAGEHLPGQDSNPARNMVHDTADCNVCFAVAP